RLVRPELRPGAAGRQRPAVEGRLVVGTEAGEQRLVVAALEDVDRVDLQEPEPREPGRERPGRDGVGRRQPEALGGQRHPSGLGGGERGPDHATDATEARRQAAGPVYAASGTCQEAHRYTRGMAWARKQQPTHPDPVVEESVP